MKIGTLDIETLDTNRSTAIVWEVGLIVVDVDEQRKQLSGTEALEFEWVLDVTSQVARGRTSAPDTVAFQNRQFPGGEFEKLLERPTTPMRRFFTELRVNCSGLDELWVNGLSFDPPLLESLAHDFGEWHGGIWLFRIERDVRTIKAEWGINLPQEGKKHRALDDCRWNLRVLERAGELRSGVVNAKVS